MMVAHAPAAVPPSLEGFRRASERWVRRERARARLTSGVEMLDRLLGGGWPQGKVGELVGPTSSGRSAVAAATVAAATARGEVTAWIDVADAFDPASAAAADVDLARLLWVRSRDAGETVRAAELVLETGGFTVVVLDLGSAAALSGGRAGRGRGALSLRLARAVERAGAVALVLAERPWAGTLAGATVALRRGEARWGGARGGSRWLDGLALRPRVERGAACRAEKAGPVASGQWPAGHDAWSVDRGPWSEETETAGSSHKVPVIARSGACGAVTKQSRFSSPACGGGEEGVEGTAPGALTPTLSRARERVKARGGDSCNPTIEEPAVRTALGA